MIPRVRSVIPVVELSVHWKRPARNGATCYRPGFEASDLRELFREELSSIDGTARLSFEETLTAASDEEGSPRILIEGRMLSDWARELGEDYQERWESTIQPALESRDFDALRRKDFLRELLRIVVENTIPSSDET